MQGSTGSGARDGWGTHAGFLLAAIGSAVGLGNMWRFSYIATQGGGAVFVGAYVLLVAIIGIPLMTSEFVIGRLTQMSPARAMKNLGGSAWAPLGWLFALSAFGILSYYSVIAGWTMRYAVTAVGSGIPTDAGAFFGEVATGTDALLWHLLFMAITIVIVLGGIRNGIERASVILMPVLFALLLGLAIWAFTLHESVAAYGAYLEPDWSHLFNRKVLTDAAGQAFFSLGLGGGVMMTYASYVQSKRDLGVEATVVSACDFGVAFIAGLIVFPVVFTFGLSGQVSESSVGALFIALPAGFASMGAAGQVVGVSFFVMLFFAALTSAISLLEVPVAAFVDSLGWTRHKAALVIGAALVLAGAPSAYDTNVLGAADAIVGNFLLIVGGLLTSLFVGYKILPQADAELALGLSSPALRRGWAFLLRYVIPVVLIVLLYFLLAPTWDAVLVIVGRG
jgi:NSS family neurotransmitter:Na+ symporter